MKLKELLNHIPVLECTADPELEINAVHYDSRKVTEGSLFVAVTGFASDGNRFIPMALSKGAVAVVTAKKPEEDVPYILVESDRLALALLGNGKANYDDLISVEAPLEDAKKWLDALVEGKSDIVKVVLTM